MSDDCRITFTITGLSGDADEITRLMSRCPHVAWGPVTQNTSSGDVTLEFDAARPDAVPDAMMDVLAELGALLRKSGKKLSAGPITFTTTVTTA